MNFRNRYDAGSRLGEALDSLQLGDCVVFGMPRGGVPVAAEVARALGAPLDVIVARKLGVPGHRELGFGAIAETGVAAINQDLVDRLGISRAQIDAVMAEESAELARRVKSYRPNRGPAHVSGRTAVLVDDGLATGYTARAGVEALRELGAARVLLAVPVGAPETLAEMKQEGYEVYCYEVPEYFMAVGQWYDDFAQTSDREVMELLSAGTMPSRGSAAAGIRREDVAIPAGRVVLPGDLSVPDGATTMVVFAHGSGSSRLSPRNIEVAEALNREGLATLLFDLLTPEEAADRRNVFDIELLAQRLVVASRWTVGEGNTGAAGLKLAFFGASTGAAAALVAAAALGDDVHAVVSRGGRPDLAGSALGSVTAPTLLIVGGADTDVLVLNREAAEAMQAEVDLVVVPGAGHLFEEPGALSEVSDLASAWFRKFAAPGD